MNKRIPDFKSVDEEAKFWKGHSVLEFMNGEEVSDFLKLTGNKSAVISLRLEPLVREQTRKIAKNTGKNYQTVMREWIYEGLTRELERERGSRPGRIAGGRNEIEAVTELVMSIKEDLDNIKGAIAGD